LWVETDRYLEVWLARRESKHQIHQPHVHVIIVLLEVSRQ
jgi:hypothetical protein